MSATTQFKLRIVAISLKYESFFALTEESPEVWDAIIAYVGQGGTAIAMAHFSSFVKPNKIRPFFAKAGLAWESGDYHWTAVALRPQIAGSAAERL
ncbi:hypothetical protein CGGC5_v013114 [Colletotrichum fructicola Nara gc5]|uniref:Uncharacterized protein n=1 Tax=Colletotrichum fructicola (strain Nara gc5) TaxID=1213859 RepID=A0A7J6IPJ9_COLFN|nr:hypothetical protein CGGC5_v013114 [Colletotrichum fructicola Nara gc5]